jgi:hypothetical protein
MEKQTVTALGRFEKLDQSTLNAGKVSMGTPERMPRNA